MTPRTGYCASLCALILLCSAVRRLVYSRVDAAENCVSIAAAGAIGPLVTLLGSPSARVQEASAAALGNLAFNGVWRIP